VSENQLYACFENQVVGKLSRDTDGVMCFAYESSWVESSASFPLSLALTLQIPTYRGRPVEAFFENLLPEGRTRRAIEKLAGIAEGNDFEYLRKFGVECAGAISLRETLENVESASVRGGSTIEVTETGIVNVIERDEPLHLALGLAPDQLPRFSLAGAQAKFPCRVEENRMFLAANGEPTTHIAKLPIRAGDKLLDSVANEFIVMKLAKACGLPIPDVQILEIGYPMFVIERFDRRCDGSGVLHRLHSEDFCQALGIPSREKYASETGPTVQQCYRIIADNSVESSRDLLDFIDWIAFNLAVGNNDSHGKNLSLLLTPTGLRLAPFYDLVSTVLYPQFNQQFALPIGGMTTWTSIRFENIMGLANSLAIKASFVVGRWERVFARLQTASAEFRDEFIERSDLRKTFRKIDAEIGKRVAHLSRFALKK
jgi:serine/threonine-protein kinase HipA